MSIKQAIQNILENNLDGMRTNLSMALSKKANERLDEMKAEVGKNFFSEQK